MSAESITVLPPAPPPRRTRQKGRDGEAAPRPVRVSESTAASSLNDGGTSIDPTSRSSSSAGTGTPHAAHRMVAAPPPRERDPLIHDAAFLIWRQQNPDASFTEVNAEMRRRMMELRERERVSHLAEMKRYYDEIATLEQEIEPDGAVDVPELGPEAQSDTRSLTSDAPSGTTSPAVEALRSGAGTLSPSSPSVTGLPNVRSKRCVLPQIEAAEYNNQKLAWDLLIAPREAATAAQAQAGNETASPNAATGESSVYAAAPRGDENPAVGSSTFEDVNGWVQLHWRHATHRHEAAATRIQCAVRKLFARKRAHRLRLRRRAMIDAVLASEVAYEDTWVVAVATREEKAKEAAVVEKRVRTLKGFLARVRAWMERRRRAKTVDDQHTAATQQFAATKVQALVRGYLARQHAYLLRHPEIVEHRERAQREAAATVIQAAIRSKLTRCRLRRSHRAALRIQTQLRRLLAARRVAGLRRAMRRSDAMDLEGFSAVILQRFFKRLVQRKYDRYRREHVHIATICRVGRGMLCRRQTMGALLHGLKHRKAIIIQSCVRRMLARKAVQDRRDAAAARVVHDQRDHASGVIARAFRRAGRQRVLHENAQLDDAAREIQRVVRGHFGRRRAAARGGRLNEELVMRARRDAAVTIQALCRGFLVRRSQHPAAHAPSTSGSDDMSRQQQGAAVVMQRFFRHHVRQPKTAEAINQAARTIQRFFYCVPALRQVHRLKAAIEEHIGHLAWSHAALVIQLWTRTQIAKVRTGYLRDARRQLFSRVRNEEAAAVIVRFMRRVAAHKRYLRRREQSQPGTREL